MSETDELPEEPKPPTLRAGDVVGLLTLLKEAGRTPYGSALWECICACGEQPVFRSRNNLASARRRATSPGCRSCNIARRKAAIRSVQDEWKRARFFRSWELGGMLYSEQWERHAIHDIREQSDLQEPLDLPEGPYITHGEERSWWPELADAVPEMTLEEIGAVFGVTRERIRQIESIALNKLRHQLERLDDAADFKRKIDMANRLGVLETTTEQPKVTLKKEPKMSPKWDRNKLGIPEDCLLPKEASELLGWAVATFTRRAAKLAPKGTVKSWSGQNWPYWSLEQLEALKARYDKYDSTHQSKRRPRRRTTLKDKVFEQLETLKGEPAPPVFDASESYPVFLVVKTKVSGIPMTIPVFVQKIARADDGNHQVKIKFPGNMKDSILEHTIVVWAKDLLSMDYSPFKTPWD